jgi:hypothetical protein
MASQDNGVQETASVSKNVTEDGQKFINTFEVLRLCFYISFDLYQHYALNSKLISFIGSETTRKGCLREGKIMS